MMLRDKVALISGSTRGIGWATAHMRAGELEALRHLLESRHLLQPGAARGTVASAICRL
jgi:NAD(P)-dependent dehydrogenase (short-subunit alcohol dehydrogenase family)